MAAKRWQWRVTLDEARKQKLEQLADLLSHTYPDRDLDSIFDQMLSDSIEKHGKRRGTVKPSRVRKPGPPRPPTPGKRAPVTAAVRREVMERDGYRCTFVSEDGRRCGCTARLELDHVDGAAVTGSSRPEELTVRCNPHNQLRSIRLFGRAYVERRIAEARKERRARRTGKPIAAGGSGTGEPPTPDGAEAAGRPR